MFNKHKHDDDHLTFNYSYIIYFITLVVIATFFKKWFVSWFGVKVSWETSTERRVHFRSKNGEDGSGLKNHPLSNSACLTHGYHPVIAKTYREEENLVGHFVFFYCYLFSLVYLKVKFESNHECIRHISDTVR